MSTLWEFVSNKSLSFIHLFPKKVSNNAHWTHLTFLQSFYTFKSQISTKGDGTYESDRRYKTLSRFG